MQVRILNFPTIAFSLFVGVVFIYLLSKNLTIYHDIKQGALLKIGSESPNFSLVKTSGEALDFKELRGRKVILFFFSPTCGSCIVEAPYWSNIYKKHLPSVNLFMVGICPSDSSGLVSFQRKTKCDFPVLLDNKNVMEKYRVKTYPKIVLVDETGKIVFTNDSYPLNDAIHKLSKILEGNG